MLYEAGYNVKELVAPTLGMNQNISDSILPGNFCYYLLNMFLDPLGEARVRYGTKRIFQDDDPQYRIIKAFPYQNTNGNRQFIRYGQTFKLFTSATSKTITDTNKITLETDEFDYFVKDSYLLMQYNYNNISYPPAYYFIKNVENDLLNGTVVIEVESNSFPSPVPPQGYAISSIYYASGIIDVYDLETGALVPNQKVENLSVTCIPRGEFIASKYFICNGVDPVHVWDGTNLTAYKEFVKEFANTFNRINNTSFSFLSNDLFDPSKYFGGNLVSLKVDGATSTYTIVNATDAAGLITISTAENLVNFNGQSRVELFYSDSLPHFSYMKAANDRIFALGPGAAGNDYRNPFNALRFYASYTTSTDVNGFKFISEQTKTVPSTDITGKHGSADNLEAIAVLGNNMAFMGRHKTQVWQGTDPTTSQLPNSMVHTATLPVGIAHGDLLVELPNDVSFISPTGNVSFSTLNVAKQFAATPFSSVNPIIQQNLKDISTSDFAYRACRSFKYNSGPFAGFKIGFNDILISKYETQLDAWSVFSGDFSNSSDFVSDLDTSLFLFSGRDIFQYADGINSEIIYGDNDGKNLINFAITWPVNNKRRWANKRYEIQMDYSSSVFINKSNYANIVINGDLSKTFRIENSYKFEFRGDILGTINLSEDGVKGFHFDAPYAFPKQRLQFVGLNFFVSIIGQTLDGPWSFKEVRLFGIAER